MMGDAKYSAANNSPTADLKKLDEEKQSQSKKGKKREALIGSFNPDYNYDMMLPKRNEKSGTFRKKRDSAQRSKTQMGNHPSSMHNSMNRIDLVQTFMKD